MKTRETGRLAAGAVVVAAAWFGVRRLRSRLSAVPREREVPCREQGMFWSLDQRRDG